VILIVAVVLAAGLDRTAWSASTRAPAGILAIAAGAPAAQAAPESGRKAESRSKSSAPRVELTAPKRKFGVGETIEVRVRIANGHDVGSVPFHILYDPQVLKFEGGEEGQFLKGDGAQTAFFAAPTNTPGELVVGLSRLGNGDGASGNGELCVLRFRVLARGKSGLEFRKATVKDPRAKIVQAEFKTAKVRAK